MSATHTNRKGVTYILCQGKTKKGKPRFFFAREAKGEPVEEIPEGFVIRESVNGVVSLARERPVPFRPEEIAQVETAVRNHPKRNNYRVNVRHDWIEIYERVGRDLDDLAETLGRMGFPLFGMRNALKVRDLLGVMVDVNLRQEDGKDFIEIIVEPYPYPVSYKGGYHYRSGSTRQELKGAALDRFLLRKQGRHWDGVPAPGFALKDLSEAALAFFRQRAARSGRLTDDLLGDPDEVLINKLRLVEDSYLKRAAVLLFGKDPERLITGRDWQ